jgi:phosphopantothenoylcysteine decarboxylase/phosphopantothenate--cysteine ligase
MFSGKKILVGVTGGIAAYKTAELVREIKRLSAEVKVMMTEAAMRFVTPLTFETLSENAVLTDLFPATGGSNTVHIGWARWPDVVVICPASFNTIGKIASGIADNAVTTTIAATTMPVILCPAMNKEMYANKIYQLNQTRLAEIGYRFVAPGAGALACGEEGLGRLADKQDIIDAIKGVLFSKADFSGKSFLITAGPTEEPLDPVRFLTNPSSGKMGYALAENAALRGAEVTLISGPSGLRSFPGVRLIKVRTACQMAQAVKDNLQSSDVLIMAAAVSDFRPSRVGEQKLKKRDASTVMNLEQNPDILLEAAEQKGKRIHVGFSVETENEVENSRLKLHEKQLDFIVINNPFEQGAAFAGNTNRVTIVDSKESVEEWPLMSKPAVADKILDRILERIDRKA